MTHPTEAPLSAADRRSAILYPAMVVALLVLSVGIGTSVYVAANFVDSGAQIESDYYTRAVQWDDHRARVERAMALGWRMDVRPEATGMRVTFTDRDGQPVTNAPAGTLTVRRSNLSEPFLHGDLVPDGTGALTLEGAPLRAGIWDFFVDLPLDDGTNAFFQDRREFR